MKVLIKILLESQEEIDQWMPRLAATDVKGHQPAKIDVITVDETPESVHAKTFGKCAYVPCGKKFEPGSNRQKYCSAECRTKGQKAEAQDQKLKELRKASVKLRSRQPNLDRSFTG
jgi:hypothetical protein